jgi:hypothetical protein
MANEYTEGNRVETPEGSGLVVGVLTSDFEFPTGQPEDEDDEPETEEVSASSDSPAYVVALADGGNGVFKAEDLEEFEGESFSDKDADAKDLAGKAEMAEVYQYTDEPHDYAELQRAKKRMLRDKHDNDNVEELLNIRGVDDPGVGFDDLPDGWNRATVLDAWTSLGGTFTTCRADMVGEIRSPTRFCAAFKDEVLQTELWRNRF